jgi:hypothetical protein
VAQARQNLLITKNARRQVLSGSSDNTLKLWDVSEWTQTHEAR